MLAVDQLAFAGMQASANLDAQILHLLRDIECATDGSGRAVESRVEAIARRIVLDAPPAIQSTTYSLVVRENQRFPRSITECCLPRGRVDDVGEQDCRQNRVQHGRGPVD